MKPSHDFVYAPGVPKYESLDPLDADRWFNLPVMRMLNLTPIEVSSSDRLTSQILSDFGYDQRSAKIHFTVRPGLEFSDGSQITVEDVAFSIARMAYTRPRFPVISEIYGLEHWRALKNALATYPAGIRINGNHIEIQLGRNVANPLFRFCLELFSIIPKSSVDLSTNKLKVQQPPTSGNYVIAAENEDEVKFILRLPPVSSEHFSAPQEIKFHYFKSEPDLTNTKQFSDSTIISGDEFTLKSKGINLESHKYQVVWGPASDFMVLILNPRVKPFDDVRCRRLFMKTFRSEVNNILGGNANVEPGMFPKLVPGYLSEKELNYSADDLDCGSKLQSYEIPWAVFPLGIRDILRVGLEHTAVRLGMRMGQRMELATPVEHEKAFEGGRSAFLLGRTAFWPLDAVGDVRMLFTPNLHHQLRDVWSDHTLIHMLDELGNETNSSQIKIRMQEINRYLFMGAIFNPFVHYRSYIASKGKGTIRSVPLAVQMPYPWQMFDVGD